MPDQKEKTGDQRSFESNEPIASRPKLPEGYGVPKTKKGMLPWSFVIERMSEARIYWIATTRPDGRPHAVPLWGAWLEDVLYFEGSPETRHGKNLSANPAVAVHLESGDQVVILEGEAREVQNPDHAITTRLAEIYAQKYQGYAPTPESWDAGGLYAVKPRVALAWMHFPKDVTRWKFRGE